MWSWPFTTSDRPVLVLDRSHDAAIIGLDLSASMTSYATRNNLTGIKVYRSKRARIIDPVINGVVDTITVSGNTVAGSADNTEDLTLSNVTVGPLVGSGPHFFGAHVRTRGKGLLVHGTLIYDALQVEAPGAVDASRGFYWEGIDVRSCAARGIYINPNNITPHLKDVKVRNPGRLADGTTIVGYDQNVPANATNNSCITVFGSGAILEDIDVSGGLTVNPTNQPAVTWTQAGYGVTLSSTHEVEFRGFTKFGTNDGGDLFVDNPSGYNVNQKSATILRPERKPVIVQGTSSTMAVPVLSNASPTGTSRAELVSLFPTWNVAGPDAAAVGWFPLSGVVSSVIASTESVGHSRIRVTETTGNFSSVTVPLPNTVQLAKNGVAHLLMVAKFNAPAPQFSWVLGNVTARRTTFAEATAGRDYQAGVTRRIQSTVRFSAADTLTNSFQIWWNYGSTVTNLDMEIEAMWLYVGDDPYAAPPVFDYGKPEGTLAVPTLGTWSRGQTLTNTSPSASGNMGWVCVTAGTPGTWKTYGAIGA